MQSQIEKTYDEHKDSKRVKRKARFNSEDSSDWKKSKRSRRSTSSYRSYKSRSRSPYDYRTVRRCPRYYGSREYPQKSCVLGIFGLSNQARENDLYDCFNRYGTLFYFEYSFPFILMINLH